MSCEAESTPLAASTKGLKFSANKARERSVIRLTVNKQYVLGKMHLFIYLFKYSEINKDSFVYFRIFRARMALVEGAE